jgi:hypothetical protein
MATAIMMSCCVGPSYDQGQTCLKRAWVDRVFRWYDVRFDLYVEVVFRAECDVCDDDERVGRCRLHNCTLYCIPA